MKITSDPNDLRDQLDIGALWKKKGDWVITPNEIKYLMLMKRKLHFQWLKGHFCIAQKVDDIQYRNVFNCTCIYGGLISHGLILGKKFLEVFPRNVNVSKIDMDGIMPLAFAAITNAELLSVRFLSI
jgi:hypothetical protein